jgi:hypothetical protein
MRKLRSEMHRRMLGDGYCARPVGLDCHFESICESCVYFQTTLEFRPTLKRQRDESSSRYRSAPANAGAIDLVLDRPRENRSLLVFTPASKAAARGSSGRHRGPPAKPAPGSASPAASPPGSPSSRS